MVLKNLKQPPFNTSLLGVLRAAADFYSGSTEEETAGAARELSKRYEVIADNLARTSDRDMPAAEKIALLETARDNETEAINGIEALAAVVV